MTRFFVEYVVLSRPGPAGYQLTLWSDVARWDGEAGSLRPGSWRAAVPAGWWTKIESAVENLGSAKAEATGVALTVQTSRALRVHNIDDNKPNAAWFLACAIDGFSIRLGWQPLEENQLRLEQGSISARASVNGTAFVVLEGSQARTATAPSLEANYKRLREQFLDDGTFVSKGSVFVVTKDIEFKSPSAAACVLLGSNHSGRRAWRGPDGRTLAELEVDGGD